MISQEFKNLNLPDSPGVYFFLGPKKEVLYVGKATSLKDRVKSYFLKDLLSARGPLLVKMVSEARTVAHITTDSVLEALMLEAAQIKKHKPHYNSLEKDDKSFNMVVITDEDYPRVLVVRARNVAHWNQLEAKSNKLQAAYGPFPHGSELREALRIIRKIFPYRDKCVPKEELKDPSKARPCFNAQIGLCPGTCAGWMSKREYRKQIKHLHLFFEGKKDDLVKSLEKEMKKYAKEENFEEADKAKKTLYALEHIQDVGLIKRDYERQSGENVYRIEAYDIAHISGKDTVGVMVVVEDGEVNKSQYRKFRIRGQHGKVDVNDIENLKEVIRRRLGHIEWPLPNLIVVDGSKAQINAARAALLERNFTIELAAVTKDVRHKQKEITALKSTVEKWGKSILLANAEAHRFAIGYHRKLRSKGFRI